MDYYVIQDEDKPSRRAIRRSAKSALRTIRNFQRRGSKNVSLRNNRGQYLKPADIAALIAKKKLR